MYQGRACYLDKWPGDKVFPLRVPLFPDDGTQVLNRQGLNVVTPIGEEIRDLSIEDLLDEIDRIGEALPMMPPFEILQNFFKQPIEVCPTSLLELYIMYLIDSEQAVREYNTLPYSGGLWDQPNALLECFTQIRYERNQYERIRMERIARKTSKQNIDTPGKTIAKPSASEAVGLLPQTRNM